MRRFAPIVAVLLAGCVSTPRAEMPSAAAVDAAAAAAEAAADAAEAAADAAEAAVAVGSYPETRRVDVVEPQFGVNVADPYRWLENDVRNDAEVAAWVAAQNRVTDAYLDALPLKDSFKARMTELYDYERYGLPRKRGNTYFYSKNDGLQNQSVLYVRDGLNGAPRVLIDPNGWSQDGATALAEWTPSEMASCSPTPCRTAAPTGAPCACWTSRPARRSARNSSG